MRSQHKKRIRRTHGIAHAISGMVSPLRERTGQVGTAQDSEEDGRRDGAYRLHGLHVDEIEGGKEAETGRLKIRS